MAKKEAAKKKKTADIDIKVRNIDKLCQMEKNKKICGPCQSGCGFWVFGSALAMILSFERSASILWAILHGILSWFYIIYRVIQIWGWI